MKRECGAAEGIRTPDPRITNALLYQLSYRGTPAEITRDSLSRQPLVAADSGRIATISAGAPLLYRLP